MNLFSLSARIDLDTGAFIAGLDAASGAFADFAGTVTAFRRDVLDNVKELLYGEVLGPVRDFAEQSAETLRQRVGDAGEPAGAVFAEGFAARLGGASPSVRDGLAAVLGEAGFPAGWAIAEQIGSALASGSFSVNVRANVQGLPIQRNASAMVTGRVFNRPTVFGYSDGAFQVAGDAGPEAVVGTQSLARMIGDAVNAAMASAMPAVMPAAPSSRPLNLVLELDGQTVARGVYELYNEEDQRVGVRFVRR